MDMLKTAYCAFYSFCLFPLIFEAAVESEPESVIHREYDSKRQRAFGADGNIQLHVSSLLINKY